jgi:hypothetical protein
MGEIIYLSPSGFAFDQLKPEDYIGMALSTGRVVEGQHRPKSEVGTPRFLTEQQLQDLDTLGSEKYRRNLFSHPKRS